MTNKQMTNDQLGHIRYAQCKHIRGVYPAPILTDRCGTQCKRGTVLAVVLIVVFVLFFIGLALGTSLLGGLALSGLDKMGTVGRYLAESGIQRAAWRLAQDVDWSDTTPPSALYSNQSLAEGTYDVTLSERGRAGILIKATGKVAGIEQTLTARALRTPLTANAWWNVNYSYRSRLTISNPGAAVVPAGYSVVYQLDTATLVGFNKMRSDGADLRVVYWDTNRWVELDRDVLQMGTAQTKIWFALQRPINGGSNDPNYAIYYGNAESLVALSNKDKVYYFQDDFNRPNANMLGEKWQVPVGLSASIQNNEAEIITNGTDSYCVANMRPIYNCIITYLVYIRGNNDEGSLLFRSDADRLPAYLNRMQTVSNSGRFYYWVTNSWQVIGTNRWTPARRRWYNIRLEILDSALRCYVDNALQLNDTDTRISNAGQIGFYSGLDNSRASYDDVIVRLYQTPEPTVNGSAEEKITDFTKLQILGLTKQ